MENDISQKTANMGGKDFHWWDSSIKLDRYPRCIFRYFMESKLNFNKAFPTCIRGKCFPCILHLPPYPSNFWFLFSEQQQSQVQLSNQKKNLETRRITLQFVVFSCPNKQWRPEIVNVSWYNYIIKTNILNLRKMLLYASLFLASVSMTSCLLCDLNQKNAGRKLLPPSPRD